MPFSSVCGMSECNAAVCDRVELGEKYEMDCAHTNYIQCSLLIKMTCDQS